MPLFVKDKIQIIGTEKEIPQLPEETIELVSNYHEENHGELQKLFNLKSDYLRDIIDFKNNK